MRVALRSMFAACAVAALMVTGLAALPASAEPSAPTGAETTECIDGYVAQYKTVATYGRLIALQVTVSHCDGSLAPYSGTWAVSVGGSTVSLNNGHYGSVYYYGRDQIVLPGYDSVYDATLTYTPWDPDTSAYGAAVVLPLTLRSAPLPVVDAAGYATVDTTHPGKVTLYAAAQHTGASSALTVDPFASGSIEIWSKGQLLQTVPLVSHYPPPAVCQAACSVSAKLTVDGVEGDQFTMRYSGDGVYAPSSGVVVAGDTRSHRNVELVQYGTSWRDFGLGVHVTGARATFIFNAPYTVWVDGVARATFTLYDYRPASEPVDSWAYVDFRRGAAPVGTDPIVAYPYGPAIEVPEIASGQHAVRVTSPATVYLAPVDVSRTLTAAASQVTFNGPMTASSSSVRAGDPVVLSTSVVDANGELLDGIPVLLERQVVGGWQVVARTVSHAGYASAKVVVPSSGTYRMRGEATGGYLAAQWPAGYEYGQVRVTAATVAVAVGAPVFSSLHPAKGASTTVRASVRESASGQGAQGAVVAFQRQASSGAWVTVGTTSSRAGVAALKVVVADGGRWRALVVASGPFRSATSASTSMRVARTVAVKVSGSGAKRLVTAKVSPAGKVELLVRKSGAWRVVKTTTAKSVSGVGTAKFTVRCGAKMVTYKVVALADTHAASAVRSVTVPAHR